VENVDIASEGSLGVPAQPSVTRRAPDAEMTIISLIQALIRRRSDEHIDVELESNLYEDLMFDSLEIAELSTSLEDHLGSDPYSIGIAPLTVGELAEFYEGPAGDSQPVPS
jgi:acyl carrier protein